MADATSLIQQFRRERSSPTSMLAVADAALLSALGPEAHAELAGSPIGKAVRSLSSAIDSAPPLPGGEPAYHNIAHFKEAVMAAAAIAGAEFEGPGRARLVGLAVLAMVGHDFQHDGTVNSPEKDKSLEQVSWEACAPHLAASGMEARDMAAVESVILGTDPALMVPNRARYLGSEPEGPLGRDVDRLRAVANEADVAGSLLPGVGQDLGALLAQEWNAAGIPMGRTIATWGARQGFLGFASTATAGSKAIGLEAAREAQMAAFASLAAEHGLPDRKAACAMLDDLAASGQGAQANALFAAALASQSPELAAKAFAPAEPACIALAPQASLLDKLGAFRAARQAAEPGRAPRPIAMR